MKISITGASGHIGNNLCRELINQKHRVKALVHTFDKSLQGVDVERVNGNILDKKAVNTVIEGADYVFHTAAIISIGVNSKDKIFQTNIEGTRNVIEACLFHKVKRLVHFSSIHALKSVPSDKLLDESGPLAGIEAFYYSQSKANAEILLLDACNRGLNTIILNPSSVVGPYDFVPSLAGQMIIKIATGKLPFLIKGGYHWVDVRDVVSAAINAMGMGQSGERYLLTSQWISLLDIAAIICNEVNRKTPAIIPDFLAWTGLPFIQLFSKLSGNKALYTKESLNIVSTSPKLVNHQKAVKELGFNPRPVEQTFVDSLHWFQTEGNINIRKPLKTTYNDQLYNE